METMDDAGIFRLSEDTALVQTIDFFSPAVNDARSSGRIVAANCLSDIWAMGGRPLTAMNILGFPASKLPMEVIQELLAGAGDKLVEAGVALVGGHSVDQKDVMFGMSITGVIHPGRAVRNSLARAGDALILTKPLGSGVLCTALKEGHLEDAALDEAVRYMERLNRYASEVLSRFDVSALTDVTGFGLAGHAAVMAKASDVLVELDAGSIPVLDGALAMAEHYLPGGSGRNWEFDSANVGFPSAMDERLTAVMLDAQTSGGLLVAVRPDQAAEAVRLLREGGDDRSCVIGRVMKAEGPHRVRITV
jgi:selenide, water dikinase